MDGQRAAPAEFPEAEQRAHRADGQPQIQQGMAAQTDARKRHLRQVRQVDVRVTGKGVGRPEQRGQHDPGPEVLICFFA